MPLTKRKRLHHSLFLLEPSFALKAIASFTERTYQEITDND